MPAARFGASAAAGFRAPPSRTTSWEVGIHPPRPRTGAPADRPPRRPSRDRRLNWEKYIIGFSDWTTRRHSAGSHKASCHWALDHHLQAPTSESGVNPHFSQVFCCGGGYRLVCCVALPRGPRRTAQVRLRAARSRRLASKPISASSPRTLVRNAGYGLPVLFSLGRTVLTPGFAFGPS